MELQIGQKIKELRRSRNLTQEEMAAHLGISFQAISKWERGDGYPDITLLPSLASYFHVSVDTLLGTNEAASRNAYNELNQLWQENNAAGKHRENISILRKGLKEFPNDALLLVQLSTSLEKLEGTEAEQKAYLRESAAVQKQIILYGNDSEIRGATQFNICFTYYKLGEFDKAIEQAKKLPNLYKSRENALVSFLTGMDKYRMAKTALAPLKWSIQLHLCALAEETQNDTYRTYAEQICSILSEIEMTA